MSIKFTKIIRGNYLPIRHFYSKSRNSGISNSLCNTSLISCKYVHNLNIFRLFTKTSVTLESNDGKTRLIKHLRPLEDKEKIIWDTSELQQQEYIKEDPLIEEEVFDVKQEEYDPYDYVNLERGKSGVFEVEELVDVLRDERAMDICVISVPKAFNYVDYIIIVTGRSHRQIGALATRVRQIFKRKNLKPTDILPKIEGKDEKLNDWLALDLGNIALHIFQEDKRRKLDLETLWTVGFEYDELSNYSDPEINEILGVLNINTEIETSSVKLNE